MNKSNDENCYAVQSPVIWREKKMKYFEKKMKTKTNRKKKLLFFYQVLWPEALLRIKPKWHFVLFPTKLTEKSKKPKKKEKVWERESIKIKKALLF